MIDVLKAELLELRDRFATAEATGAIEEHWLVFVECEDLRIKGVIADRNVHGLRQSAAFKFTFRPHIEHLSFGMLAELSIRLVSIQILTHAARRGF